MDDLAVAYFDYVMGLQEKARATERKGAERHRGPHRVEPDRTSTTASTGSLVYWLIAKFENGRIEVLTLNRDGDEMLPVFGHEEEAEMYFQFGGLSDDWWISESDAGELISVLYGSCADVKEVALDPLPAMVDERTVGLVSLANAL